MKLSFFPLLLAFLLPSFICASETDSLKTYFLGDSIVVIANRYEMSIQSVTNTVDIIPIRDYQAMATHSALELIDALSPSAFVTEKKILGYGLGRDGAGSIYMRGMGGKPNSGVLVLINGRPDFMGIFGHPLPDVYGLDNIEKMEVIKGPSSAVFGSNAMAGVVNLITESSHNERLSLQSQFGNYETMIHRAGMDFRWKGTESYWTIGHSKSKGHIDSTGFEEWSFSGQINRQLSPHWQISLDGKYVPYQFDDPARKNDPAQLGYYAKIRRGMAHLRLSGTSGKLNSSFHLYSNLGHHRFYDGFESHDFTYGFSSYQHLRFSRQMQLGFGMDALYYGGKAKNVVFPMAPINSDLHTLTTLGGYLVGFYTPISQITVKGGIRYQTTSQDIQKLTPTAGVSVIPFSRLKLYANYNRGFRVPTLQELYLFEWSNPDLKPEEVESYELGSVFYFMGNNSISLAYFHNDLSNIIQMVAPPLRYINGQDARQWGVETQLQFRPFPFTGLILSYSYLDPDVLTAYNPRHMYKYLLDIRLRKLNVQFYGKYITDLYADNYQQAKLDDYHLLNLSFIYPVGDLDISLQLRNLLDTRYQVLPGYPAPGFHFLFGFRLKVPRKTS